MSVVIIPKSILRMVIDPNSKTIESIKIPKSTPIKEPDIRYPVAGTVAKTSILIREFDSDNSEALIQCRSNSNRTGRYLYTYFNREHKKVEYIILSLSLFNEGDEEIKVDAFLTC